MHNNGKYQQANILPTNYHPPSGTPRCAVYNEVELCTMKYNCAACHKLCKRISKTEKARKEESGMGMQTGHVSIFNAQLCKLPQAYCP